MAWNRWAALCMSKRACFASPERSIGWIWTKLGLYKTKHLSGAVQTLQDAGKIRGGFNLGDQVGLDGCSGGCLWRAAPEEQEQPESSQEAQSSSGAPQERSNQARRAQEQPEA